MDWGRAKTILIFAFLCLNLLLGYQLWFHKMDFFDFLERSPNLSSETKQILEEKGIKLSVDIPEETPKVKEITVRVQDESQSDEIVRFLEPMDPRVIDDKSIWKDTIAKQIDHADEYEFDAILSTTDQYVFDQIYEGIPMFEVNLVLYEEDGQIYGYQQRYVQVNSSADSSDQNILPAHLVVEFLAGNILPEGSVIQDIRLGYHGQRYDSDMQYFAPKWRISLQDGTVYYIHAINGEVETAQKGL